jgi:hypothetical protein
MATTTAPGTAGDLLLLLRALTLAGQLVTLDDAWTSGAQAHAAGPPAPDGAGDETDDGLLDALAIVADAYEATWLEFADVSERLEPLFAAHADVIRRGQPALVARMSETGRGKLEKVLAANADLSVAARSAAANMRSSADSEIRFVRSEIDKLAKGGRSAGDMNPTEEAAVHTVAAAAGFLLGPEATAFIEVVAHTSVGESIVHAVEGLWHSIFG